MRFPHRFDTLSWAMGLIDGAVQRIETGNSFVVSISVQQEISKACIEYIRSRGMRAKSQTQECGQTFLYLYKHEALEWLLDELLDGSCSRPVACWLHGSLRGESKKSLLEELVAVVNSTRCN